MPDLLMAFALAAIVLTVSPLVSRLVERAPLSFPIIFLGVGFVLGGRGLGLVYLGPHDRVLEVVGIFTLCLVLFLDAARLQLDELGRQWAVPVLILGPGTVAIIGVVAGLAGLLLALPIPLALLVGAVLASTDPVVLRDVVRDQRLPRPIRQALKLEAGLNDIVVLPIVLVLLAVAKAEVDSPAGWAMFLAQLLVIGPTVGFVIGGAGAWLMTKVDAGHGISREYQALYGIGLVLAAYAAGTAVGGDGFLASFAAGLAVVVLNQELCDCFLEFGEIVSEMAMLLAFVLFGVVLSELLDAVPLVPTLVLAVVAIFVVRPVMLQIVLLRTRLSKRARAYIGWFGPRGLNSLLLALLAVQAGIPNAELLLGIVGLVVIVSVVLHGASATPLAAYYGRAMQRATLAEERDSTLGGALQTDADDLPRVTVAELADRLAGPNPPLILDVRSRSAHERDGGSIPGSVRVLPDQVREWAAKQTVKRPVVAYCT